jgi:hypothetical protein
VVVEDGMTYGGGRPSQYDIDIDMRSLEDN